MSVKCGVCWIRYISHVYIQHLLMGNVTCASWNAKH